MEYLDQMDDQITHHILLEYIFGSVLKYFGIVYI